MLLLTDYENHAHRNNRLTGRHLLTLEQKVTHTQFVARVHVVIIKGIMHDT